MPTTCKARRSAAALIVTLLALSGCGDDDIPSRAADDLAVSADSNENDTGSRNESDDPDGDDDGASSGTGAAELHPDLADIPMPEGYVVPFEASAYTADEDPRQTVTQNVHLTQDHSEAFDFFLDALPVAGFTVDDNAAGGLIRFENPEGVPGQLMLMPMPEDGTNVNINLYRGG